MDEATERRIAELRTRIREILDRRDGGLECDSCLALSVLFQFVWMEPPYCPPVRAPTEIEGLTQNQFAEMMENGWRSWGTPFAALSLPIPGFQDEALCEVALIIDEDESLRYDSFDEETHELKPSGRTDDVEARKRDFHNVFDLVAEIATLASPGASKEHLLSHLVNCVGKTERWKPTFRQGCVISYIEAYLELDYVLEQWLNPSKFSGAEMVQPASNQVPFASSPLELGAKPTMTPPAMNLGTAIEAEYEFRRDGDGYFLRGFGEEGHVTATGATGLHDIFRLVQSAGTLVPMVELNGGSGIERLNGDSHSRQDAANQQTRKDIAARRRQLKEDIENADSDLEKSELQDQLEKLDTEAKKLWGLEGKPRDLNNPINNSRSRIHGRMKKAWQRLKTCTPKPFPLLGEHFALSIEARGPCFKYTPPIPGHRWQTESNK